jgi:hypothetical protein
VPEVVASIPTRDGTPWLRIGTWSVFVSPLVDAPSVMRAGMSLDGWRRFGEIAARIHATRLPDELSALLATETFEPRMTALARTVDRHVGDGDDSTDDPLAASVRDRWQAERPAILHLVALAEALGARIRDRQAGGRPVTVRPVPRRSPRSQRPRRSRRRALGRRLGRAAPRAPGAGPDVRP